MPTPLKSQQLFRHVEKMTSRNHRLRLILRVGLVSLHMLVFAHYLCDLVLSERGVGRELVYKNKILNYEQARKDCCPS